MKAVILRLAPEVTIVDISHQVPAFDIQHGALLLKEAAPLFPDGTIHLAVVDPGVGGQRKRVIVEAFFLDDRFTNQGTNTRKMYFVGPDNGLFALVGEVASQLKVWDVIAHPSLGLISKTFEGRDLFSIVAAKLLCGVNPQELGSYRDLLLAPCPQPLVIRGSLESIGEVSHFDVFGNAITNLQADDVELRGTRVSFIAQGIERDARIVEFYEQLANEEVGALINSQGFLEIAILKNSVQKILGLCRGDKVRVRKSPQ